MKPEERRNAPLRRLICLLLLLCLPLAPGRAEYRPFPNLEIPSWNGDREFDYNWLPDGTVRITRWLGEAETLTVPAELDGYPVAAIAREAFRSDVLREIILPEGIVWLEKDVFYYCMNLRRVSFPASLIRLMDTPFGYCPALAEIAVAPDNPVLSVEDGALYERTEQRLVCWPAGRPETSAYARAGTRVIGYGAFSHAKNLTQVYLPYSLEVIGDFGFEMCSSLAQISLPSGLREIGACAFDGCSSLTEVIIPDSVWVIREGAFLNCSGLMTAEIRGRHTRLERQAFSRLQAGDITVFPLVNDLLDLFAGRRRFILIIHRGCDMERFCREEQICWLYSD